MEFGSGEEQEDKRFLCCYAERTAQVKSDPKGWSLRWHQIRGHLRPMAALDQVVATTGRSAFESAMRAADELAAFELAGGIRNMALVSGTQIQVCYNLPNLLEDLIREIDGSR